MRKNSHGVVAVEYAILTGIVILSLLAGLMVVGPTLAHTLQQISQALDTSSGHEGHHDHGNHNGHNK